MLEDQALDAGIRRVAPGGGARGADGTALRCIIDEGLHLGLEHFGRHRHEHIVARAHLEAEAAIEVARAVRGQEQDRRGKRARPGAHQARGLEAVAAGHLDVHEDDAKILLEQAQQGLFARAGDDQVGVEVAEHPAQGEQRARVVMDQQDRRSTGRECASSVDI